MNNAISFFSQVSKDVLARASASWTRNHRSNHGIRDCINFAPEKTERLFSCFIFLLQQHQISSTVIYTAFKLQQVLNPTVRFLNVLISLHGNYMSQKYFDNSVFRLIGFLFFSLCIFSSASKIFKALKSIILRRASRNKNIPGPCISIPGTWGRHMALETLLPSFSSSISGQASWVRVIRKQLLQEKLSSWGQFLYFESITWPSLLCNTGCGTQGSTHIRQVFYHSRKQLV